MRQGISTALAIVFALAKIDPYDSERLCFFCKEPESRRHEAECLYHRACKWVTHRGGSC